MSFTEKLPYGCDHQTIVYQLRVFHVGGYNNDKRERSNVISEFQPYRGEPTVNSLSRQHHHTTGIFC